MVQWRQEIAVVGSATTTPNSVDLNFRTKSDVAGSKTGFQGTALGIFTPNAKPFDGVKLRTNDFNGLCSKGKVFFYANDSQAFVVTFYDDDNNPLGQLRANRFPAAISPGSGSGEWTSNC